MASNYFSKQNPTDISLQSEDGGGLIFTNKGKFLFGAKTQAELKDLNEKGFQGDVDVNPNNNTSFIGITNDTSDAIEIDVANKNQYSLYTPPDNDVKFSNLPNEDCDDTFDAVLIGGLDDTSKGYKNINEQLEIFKKGYGNEKNVKAFSWSTSITIITNFLKDHPKVPVIMFSKGCEYANKIVAVNGINKKRIYIVEPYATSSNTKKTVQDAVTNGVLPENVYVGPTSSVGKGVINNPSDTNYKGTRTSHWDALKIVGEVMKENIKCGGKIIKSIDKPKESTPPISPTPTPAVSKTAQEIEDGIYEANFLPASEDDQVTYVYTEDEKINDEIVKLIELGKITTVPINAANSTKYKIDAVDLTTMSQYVKIAPKGTVGSSDALKDWEEGIINPKLVIDIATAAKAAGIVATITTAKRGHSTDTTSGNLSRHMNGTGVDVAILDGIGAGGATNASNGNAKFRELGYKLKDALVQMGYKWNTESGYNKAVLWQTNTGGNHYNHLHISNRITK